MNIEITYEMDVAAADVWQVAGEGFCDLSWSDGVTHSELEGELGVGAIRTCHFEPNMFSREGLVREELVVFDRENREFAYQTDLGGVMRTVTNRWTVEAIDAQRSRTRMRASIELRGAMRLATPFFRLMLRRMGLRTLRELEARARLVG